MKMSGIGRNAVVSVAWPISKKVSSNSLDKSKQFQKTFESVLSNVTDLQFSSHAIDRLSGRGVRFNEQTVNRLTEAVNKAGQKGAKQSLVLLDELAFLVSVKNRMVITALDADKMKEGVFTHIDSAVIG